MMGINRTKELQENETIGTNCKEFSPKDERTTDYNILPFEDIERVEEELENSGLLVSMKELEITMLKLIKPVAQRLDEQNQKLDTIMTILEKFLIDDFYRYAIAIDDLKNDLATLVNKELDGTNYKEFKIKYDQALFQFGKILISSASSETKTMLPKENIVAQQHTNITERLKGKLALSKNIAQDFNKFVEIIDNTETDKRSTLINELKGELAKINQNVENALKKVMVEIDEVGEILQKEMVRVGQNQVSIFEKVKDVETATHCIKKDTFNTKRIAQSTQANARR